MKNRCSGRENEHTKNNDEKSLNVKWEKKNMGKWTEVQTNNIFLHLLQEETVNGILWQKYFKDEYKI